MLTERHAPDRNYQALFLALDDAMEALDEGGEGQIAACEEGRSVPGVSSSRIQEAVERLSPVMVQDPELLLGAHATEALAVLYVQNYGVVSAFGEIDRAWIEVYARALGRALAVRR
jgi:hypothetical protein